MAATMLVSLPLRGIIAGKAKQIAHQLTDTVAQVGRLIRIDQICSLIGQPMPRLLGHQIDARRIGRPACAVADHARQVITNLIWPHPAGGGGADAISFARRHATILFSLMRAKEMASAPPPPAG